MKLELDLTENQKELLLCALENSSSNYYDNYYRAKLCGYDKSENKSDKKYYEECKAFYEDTDKIIKQIKEKE